LRLAFDHTFNIGLEQPYLMICIHDGRW